MAKTLRHLDPGMASVQCILLFVLLSVPAWGAAIEMIRSEPSPEGLVYHCSAGIGYELNCYDADTAKLNEYLRDRPSLKEENIVLRPGPSNIKDLGQNRSIPCTWKQEKPDFYPNFWKKTYDKLFWSTIVTIYVDGTKISLDELQIPEGPTVFGPQDLKTRYLIGMKSASHEVRAKSVRSLVEIDPFNVENVGPILELLTSEENEWPRKEAIQALGRMGTFAEGALPWLRNAAKEDDGTWRDQYREAIELIVNAPNEREKSDEYGATVKQIHEFITKVRPDQQVVTDILWKTPERDLQTSSPRGRF